ncbi:TIGR03086 family metal-binding protein [Actinocorallia longicatena]|uniref:TIGR03086 family metal-binding protein n=1 Tax=Actinocorallia longicatena TaxID=111803 RepID=A0ABP6Q8Z8_9ACTN
MDVSDLHRRAVAGMTARIAAISPGQWTLATPCSDWDLRGLVNHVAGEMLWTPPIFEGKTAADVGGAFDGDVLGEDPQGVWEASVGPSIAAVSAEGALDRTVHLSFGDVPGEVYASQMFADILVHSWDVARASSGDELLDPDLVEACLDWFSDEEEQTYRAAGLIGPAVTPGDDAPQTVLLARFGRTA